MTSRREQPSTIPDCPLGHDGHIVLWGHHGRSADFSRPRFQCRPTDSSIKRHTFTLPRRQPGDGHPFGHACEHCERDYGPADGPRTPAHYTQTIVEISNVLTAVGKGSSLRVAGRDIRQTARRFTLGPIAKTRQRRDYASRQSILAARYLDAYGPPVLARVLPDHWPRQLVLDSKPLKIRPYGVLDWDDWDASLPSGALLTAAGRDEEVGTARTWRISLGGDETHQSWLRFFDELPGDPEWIVSDRSEAITKAVAAKWPAAIHFLCSWHLAKNLTDAAYRDGVYFETSPFEQAIRAAFHSVALLMPIPLLQQGPDSGIERPSYGFSPSPARTH